MRRYLLTSRGGLPVSPEDLDNRDYQTMHDDLAAVHVSASAALHAPHASRACRCSSLCHIMRCCHGRVLLPRRTAESLCERAC